MANQTIDLIKATYKNTLENSKIDYEKSYEKIESQIEKFKNMVTKLEENKNFGLIAEANDLLESTDNEENVGPDDHF